MGTKPPRKNRYKKKTPEKHPGRTLGRTLVIALKSVFAAMMMVAMSLVFIFIHDVLTQCRYFSAAHIRVAGESRLSGEEILAAAEVGKGVNLVAMNLKTVRDRLLAHPWIKEADVQRTFPDQLSIRVTEHKALAVVDFGKLFLINTEGHIFKEAQEDETKDLPVIRGIDVTDWPTPGKPESPVFEAVMEVLSLGASPDGVLPNGEIREIFADREMGLTLDTLGPVKAIKLGYGRYPEKYRRLARIYTWMREETNPVVIGELDLGNPERIVAKPGTEPLSEKVQKEV